MDDIIEQYGGGLIAILAVVGVVVIFMACIKSGGIISDAVTAYMNGICG